MHDIRKLIAWMAGSLFGFSALAIAVRELAGQISVFEILAIRNLGGIAIIGVYAIARQPAALRLPRMLPVHLLRNVFHFAGQTAWAYGITVLPLATVFALEFTTPAWVMVLATVFLRERATPARLVALGLGFLGVLIILRPGAESFRPQGLVVLAAAFMFAVQITTTKFLTGTQSAAAILFWMNVMQLPMYLLAQGIATGSPAIGAGLSWGAAPWVFLLCVSGLIAHVGLTNAFRYGDATTVVPIDFLRIPLVTAVGALAYGERFDPFVLLGAAVSAAGIVYSLRDTQRRARGG